MLDAKAQLSGILVQKSFQNEATKRAEYERTLTLKNFNRGRKYLGIRIFGYNHVMYVTLHS